MLFSSLTFLFGFLPILLILYFIIKNRKYKNVVLLIFSLLFYAWGEPKYILLMLLTILIVYIFGILIDKFDREKKLTLKKLSLILCIILVLGSLIFFKYSNFLIENINSIFNTKINLINVIMPIGISFYTFQILSYIIDLYNKKIKLQKNYFSLALYVSLFPQLIAGPIVRYETVEEEIDNRKETKKDVIAGTKRFIIGLSKKVIIANQMALLADLIFNKHNGSYGTSIIWLGTLAYTLQIYFDFSGYSDMAIGLGRIFGFHFLENFDYPYISKSVTEFWRRWHISLSTWFRDYVYIPLGGNRVNKFKWIRNIILVWLLTGLWHGAAWNFIIWGIYYGLLLLFEKLFLNKLLNKLPSIINWLYTFIIVMIGWMIFRSNSLNELLLFIKTMFSYKQTDWITILADNLSTFNSLIFIVPAFIISFPIFKKLNEKYSSKIIYKIILNIILLTLFLICIICLTSSSYNPFIYFRF